MGVRVVFESCSSGQVSSQQRFASHHCGNHGLHKPQSAGLPIEIVEPDWRMRFLDIITRPNVAYVMMFLGMYGLFFELSNPGALFRQTRIVRRFSRIFRSK